MSDIWERCGKDAAPVPLGGEVLRIVESQERAATFNLVDDVAEQNVLEQLLDKTKPRLHPETPPGLHYLLATPFRYPPLAHGSRFGTRFEPSPFYGSRTARAVLAEGAYYQLIFWHDMATPPESGQIRTQHTLLRAEFHSVRGLTLQTPPFNAFRETLVDPARYDATQALGAAMRDAGVEAFESVSARDRKHGLNVTLFTPKVFTTLIPTLQTQVFCTTDARGVVFGLVDPKAIYSFPREEFLLRGALPRPAS